MIVTPWNRTEAEAGYCGFVTAFEIDADFVARYPVRQLGGGPTYRELWVPTGELADFNAHIVGVIRVIESVYGRHFAGTIDPTTGRPAGVAAGCPPAEPPLD